MVGMQCYYYMVSYNNEPAGDPDEIQTMRVMNRHWTEAVNLNIGQSQNFKISQILVQTKSNLLCAYPGGDLNNFKADPSRSFLTTRKNDYWIYRSQKPLLGSNDDG